MKIEQKKHSYHHTFNFETNHVNFFCRDKSGSSDIDVDYTEFPYKSGTRIEQNLWLRSVGYLWFVLGVAQIVYAIATEKSLNGTGFWMLLGLGCLLWVRFTKVTFTVFSTVRGAVLVIQDGHDHDRIVEEIRDRRRARFLSLYGGINLEHGVENEVGKFRWLAEQQVLTPEEAEKHIARVHAASIAAEGSTPVTLN